MRLQLYLLLTLKMFAACAQEQDTSSWQLIRYKIQDETFFIKHSPNDPAHYFKRGNAKRDITMYEEAIIDFTKAIYRLGLKN